MVKTADESVSSSDTLQDDDHLSLELDADTTYTLLLHFGIDQIDTGGFAWDLDMPAGASIAGLDATITEDVTKDITWGLVRSRLVQSYGPGSEGEDASVEATIHLSMGSEGGVVTLQWAQQTSHSTATVLIEGSSMTAIKN